MWRELVIENPMMTELYRSGRKFFVGSGNMGMRGTVMVAGSVLGILYLWFLFVVARVHENMTMMLLMLELTMVTLFIPGSIYNAVSGERERATWDALVLTRLTPAQILVGKLLLRLVLVGVLIAIFLGPIVISHFAGTQGDRVTPLLSLLSQLTIITWSVMLCGYGMWVSANTTRSITTIAIIIASLLALLLLLPTLAGLFGVDWSHNSDFSIFMTLANPFVLITKSARPDTAFSSNISDTLTQGNDTTLFFVAPLLFLATGLVFLLLTWAKLRRLEVPQRDPVRG